MVRLLQAYIKKAPGMVTEEHKLVIYTIFIDTCISVAKTLGGGEWGVPSGGKTNSLFQFGNEGEKYSHALESIHTLFISRTIEGGLGCQRMSIFFALNLCNI